MKKIILILGLIWMQQAQAQKPETVHSFVREKHETSWYKEQEKLWKAEVDKNKQNGEAWYNYYRAVRALVYLLPNEESDSSKAVKIQEEYSKLMAKITSDVLTTIPNSFEANLIKSFEDGEKKDEYLLKAYEIKPSDPRTYDGLMIYYETKQNRAEHEKFALKMYQHNELPASILNWGYNLLSELDQNAVVFTCGDNDTYACWIVQAAKNHRKDVQVVNTMLILDDEYRTKIFKKYKLPALELPFKNPLAFSDHAANNEAILKHFASANIPVYVSCNSIYYFPERLNEELYLTGLAFKYSTEELDNISIIRRNYENRYLLDHLQQSFSFNIGDKIGDEFNSSYLSSMLKLYKAYKESEEFAKMKKLETLILVISEKSGQKEEVLKIINE